MLDGTESAVRLPWLALRGYIPHLDQPGLIQSLTIRLYDAVSESLIAK